MKRLFQCLGLAALLALAGWWWAGGSKQALRTLATAPNPTVSEIPRLTRFAPIQAMKADLSNGRPAVLDRFVNCSVIEQRESAMTKDGETFVRRLRLVRDESLKYPILRVEDELIRTPQGDRLVRQSAMVGDHVMVKLLDPKLAESVLLAELGDGSAHVRRRMPASGLWLVAFSEPKLETVPRAVTRLSGMTKRVRVAEPDHILRAQTTPNDPSYSTLWGLHNTGQSSGTADADIDAPEAWALSTGSSSVIVAVLDTGIDQTHPDLLANLWTNPGEIAGNSLDDDNNGYVDDTRGWDFVNSDNNPNDDNGHGTHCAGTIGAVGNNGAGVSGVCWQVSLLGLKFLDASGSGYESDGAEAISYATNIGVTLTSNSYSGDIYNQSMKDAIDEADAAGILFVAAAGNNSSNLGLFPEYPASFTSSNIVSVASTTRTDALSSFSNFSATSVDLAAPGSDIFSTIQNGGYGTKSGTSMATPHVAGACALMKSFKPALTHTQIRELLLSTVDTKPALTGKCATGGRLNVYNALLATSDILATPGGGLTASGPIGGPFAPGSQTFTLTNHGASTSGWTASVNRTWITLSPASGSIAPGASQTLTVTLNAGANQLLATTHTGTVTITSTASGRVQTRSVTLEVAAGPVFSTNLDADPGWPRTGQWAHGTPQGQGGLIFGHPDPTAGSTGTKVFGINLAGDYDVNLNTPQYLTAGPFNLSAHHSTKLRYQRWLNADYQPWVTTSVEASTDGVNWDMVWQNDIATPRDEAWTAVEHDLAAYADGHSQVYVRWGHTVSTSDAYALSGWNLDDIEISAVPDKQLRLLLPASLTEGGAAGTATVMVAPAPVANLVITLASNRPGEEVSIPASVTILAGQTDATFSVTPINDTRIDGTQNVTLTASAASWPSHSASLSVHDNESGTLTVTLPANVTEGGAPVTNQARVSLPSAAVVSIEVQLNSSDLTELTVPATVTIPQGQTQAFFTLTMPDDALLDGAQSVTVSASVTNWPTQNAALQVLDNESTSLTVTLPAARLENSGTVTGAGTVSVAGTLVNALTVTLASNDSSELTVPASVIIAAGSSQQTFDLTVVNDVLNDGAQTVQVTASAAGFNPGSTTMSIADDEQPALPTNPSPANGNSPTHPESDLAWSFDAVSGGVPDSYDVLFGTVPVPVDVLGNVTTPAVVLPRLEPGVVYHWQIIARRGAQTRSGPVWSFTVPPVGSLHHFGWSDVPAAVVRGAAFNSRVTAYDEWDNEITGFTGPVSLAACTQPAPVTTGAGAYAWFYPLACYYHDARTQSIYTPAEVGPAGRLASLALDLSKLPGQALKDFTIRLKHTSRTDYPINNRTWESDGWVTVFSDTVTLTTLGWNTFTFTTPFDYDGVLNLMVDISFNNNNYSSDGNVRSTIITGSRTLAYRTDSAYGAPVTWTATTPSGSAYNTLPNLRLTRSESSLSMTPATSGLFANGSWNGSLTVQTAANDAWLKATQPGNPGILGISSVLDVVAVNDFALNAEPLYTGGTDNTISWPALGSSYDYEIQRATLSNFSDATSTGYITVTQQAYGGLTDGQLYHYRGRARASGLVGTWSEPQRSTQDATPPVITLTPGDGGVVISDQIQLSGTGQDASGIASLNVNGGGVSSADAYANWTQSLTALSEGVNTFAITASDNAVPPNTHSEVWSILRISDAESDPDFNGVPALLEYAFNTSGILGSAALPAATQSGQHLTMTYRRRIANPSHVQYHLETSTTLTAWQPAGANAEEISATPTGDGVTETVTVRLTPAMNASSGLFVRVRVEVP